MNPYMERGTALQQLVSDESSDESESESYASYYNDDNDEGYTSHEVIHPMRSTPRSRSMSMYAGGDGGEANGSTTSKKSMFARAKTKLASVKGNVAEKAKGMGAKMKSNKLFAKAKGLFKKGDKDKKPKAAAGAESDHEDLMASRGEADAIAKDKLQNMLGSSGGVLICNARIIYTWFVFGCIFVVSWLRAMDVLNSSLRMHLLALEPAKDEKGILLKRRASRFIIFAMLFLMVTATCLFVGITAIMIYTLAQFVEMFAEHVPKQLWFMAVVFRAVGGTSIVLGGFDPMHLATHGVVLTALLALCWFYAFVYLREDDLVHANLLRDKLMRAVVCMPLLVCTLYILYGLYLIVNDCF
jgi:hypothetical protein